MEAIKIKIYSSSFRENYKSDSQFSTLVLELSHVSGWVYGVNKVFNGSAQVPLTSLYLASNQVLNKIEQMRRMD